MPRPNIRPWRDLAELLEVRHLLYPSNEAEHDVRYDSQRLGVNMVNTWKRRCRVPHSIYSTAVLVDAELHHNVEKNSTFAIRVVYSTAFARFVTGFCDIGQNSIVKRSMFEMAELIGMPEAWVELRHEITHGQVPDLRTLEHYVQASLVWLWDFFWIKLDAPHTDVTHEPTVKAEIRDILKSFLRSRRDEIKLGKKSGPDTMPAAADTAKILLRMVKKSETNTKILISVLLEEKMLIPSQKQVGRMNIKAASLMWNNLLSTISKGKRTFYSNLVNTLLAELINRPSSTATDADSIFFQDNTVTSAMCQWLVHLVTGKTWKHSNAAVQLEFQAKIAETSLLNPSPWGHKLVKDILDRADDEFRELWAPFYDAAVLEGSEDVSMEMQHADSDLVEYEKDAEPDIDMGDGESLKMSDRLSDVRATESSANKPKTGKSKQKTSNVQLPDRGWQAWEGGWVARPIGVL